MNHSNTPDESPNQALSKDNASKAGGFPITKVIVAVFVLAVIIIGYTQLGDTLSLESLAEREVELRDFRDEHPVLVYGLAFFIYVAVTGLSLPGATVLTLIYGWYFGLARGTVLVSFASTSGATLAFLLSRYLFRDSIQKRFGERLKTFNDNLEREGAFYLFSLRLVPLVPFFVINAVMGLTPMKTRTFWWVSQIGMLAGTIAYVYAGSAVPSLKELAKNGASGIISPWLFLAFGILAVLPFFGKWAVKTFRPEHPSGAEIN